MPNKESKNCVVDFELHNKNSIENVSYLINRNILKQNELELIVGYDRQKTSALKSFGDNLKEIKPKNILTDLCPILGWLPEYPVKKNLMNDIISGFTVAVMHIPQGMAYGLLAGVDPIVGLYMAFFPILIYVLFGTSRQISMGTFAVVSIMTSKIVATYSDPNYGSLNSNLTLIEKNDGQIVYSYSPFQVATAVTMICGIYHLIMSVLRLGILSSLLSEALVNGFTTAAAFHVLTSQLKDVLGLRLPKHKGAFKIILSLRDLVMNITSSNHNAIYIAVISITFMIIMNEFVKPWASKKCKFPIPAELIVVIGFTIASYVFNFGGPNYNVLIVGNIPTGLPVPTIPPFELLKLVAIDSIAVCIVSYSINMSMAKIFAKKDYYEVRPNQELLALGLSNIFGSFFSCIPICCSLSRSLIQYQAALWAIFGDF